MAAQLHLSRRATVVMELRRGPFDVVVDGDVAGSIVMHKTVDLAIAPGPHTLQVRTGRYSSKELCFEVDDNESAGFHCSGSRIWPVYLLSLLKPDLALTLTRE